MKKAFKNQGFSAVLLAGGLLASQLAVAGPLTYEGAAVNPRVLAGSENNFVSGGGIEGGAPFVPAGEFTGVVSIFIDADTTTPGGGICTGSVISNKHIITAAHCVDTPGGAAIGLGPTSTITAVFNDGGAIVDLGNAVEVINHPDYLGFGVCGPTDQSGLGGGCLNDDIAIITLDSAIPDGVEIYDFYDGDVQPGEMFTMVGHGTTGNGIDGFNPQSSDFFNKRFGFNNAEIFTCDDADVGAAFGSPVACDNNGSETEVWYADFDGTDSTGADVDFFCNLAAFLCDAGLGGDTTQALFEASIGGGDSGGPSFIYDAVEDKYLLVGNNTFGTETIGEAIGGFGNYFGGNLYRPYLGWINDVVVNAPLSIGLILTGLAFMVRRRRISK